MEQIAHEEVAAAVNAISGTAEPVITTPLLQRLSEPSGEAMMDMYLKGFKVGDEVTVCSLCGELMPGGDNLTHQRLFCRKGPFVSMEQRVERLEQRVAELENRETG